MSSGFTINDNCAWTKADLDIMAAERIVCAWPIGAAIEPLVEIIREDGENGFEAARTRAKRDKIPFYLALADRWSRRLRAGDAA